LGFIPYSGTNANVDLGSKNFLTTGTLGAGAITGTSLALTPDFLISKTGDVWTLDAETTDADTNTFKIITGAEAHIIMGIGSTSAALNGMDIGAGGLITYKGDLNGVGALGAGATTLSSLIVDTTTLVVNAPSYTNRVGIGTATPGATLDVLAGTEAAARIVGNGTALTSTYTLSIQNNGGDYDTWLEILNGYEGAGAFFGMNSASGTGGAAGDAFELWNYQGGPINFYTGPTAKNSAVRMTISNNSFVGIGTTSPAYPLDVTGRVRVTGGSGIVGAIGDGTYGLSVQNNAASSWIEILNNGGVGKGAFFGICNVRTANAFEVWNYQGGPIDFYTGLVASSSTLRWRILNDGSLVAGAAGASVYNITTAGTIAGLLRPIAGTATAGTAPLKFTSGTLTTVAVSGQVEYLSGLFYIRGTEGWAFGAATEYINSANADYLDVNATKDVRINCGANYTLSLTQPVYKDINIAGYLLGKPTSAYPGIDTFRSTGGTDTTIETYAFANDEKVHGGFELQHDYKEGTDLVFHVHWQGIAAPTGTDNIQWRLNYIVAREGVTLAAATVIDSPDTAIDTQYRCYRTDFAAITGTTFKIGDQFMFTLTRVASTGDEYAGDVLIETAGIHYQVDTLGSRAIITK
jgi:hypothetical protein